MRPTPFLPVSAPPPPQERRNIQEMIQEASSRPLEFDPRERAQLIRTMLADIPLLQAAGKTEDEIRAFSHITPFADQYPELFKKIIRKEDITPLRTMLLKLEEMGRGTLNQHEASVHVGQHLYNRYIKPKIGADRPNARGPA